MDMWTIWLIAAIIFAIIEIYTPSFFIIWFSGGSIAACITSLITSNSLVQFMVFIIVSFILVISTSKITRKMNSQNSASNSDVLIGKVGLVTQEVKPFDDKGRVNICGQSWKASPDSDETFLVGDKVKVLSIDGVTLKVTKIK